jgi:3-oxoacyl-(acyl-carrier-protein) synthase
VINAAAGQAAIWHRLRGVNSTLAAGEASGLLAIAQAAELVRAGRAAAVLAGGAEELCFESFIGMYRAGRLCGSSPRPGRERAESGEGGRSGQGAAGATAERGERPVPFDALRNGFSLSEGAALLMLEDAEAAAARGAAVRAEVLGWGSAFAVARGDAHSAGDAGAAGDGGAARDGGGGAGAPGVEALAAALARAVRLALADAGTRPAEIGCVSASASGSLEVDRAEALGLAEALGERAAAVPVTAIKAMLGEGLGVSAAWQALDLVATIGDGVLPGIAGLERIEGGLALAGATAATRRLEWPQRRRALVTAVGADGHCAALVLGAPEARG